MDVGLLDPPWYCEASFWCFALALKEAREPYDDHETPKRPAGTSCGTTCRSVIFYLGPTTSSSTWIAVKTFQRIERDCS